MTDMPLTFKVFTGALKAYTTDDGRKRISTTASSTITDHYGDSMTEACIKGMAQSAAAKAMTIFLNHSYTVPEDVFGRTATSDAVYRGVDQKTGLPLWDLDLDVEVDETNPRAVQTYRSLRGPKDDGDGQKLGVSIGALIKDYELKDPRDPWSPMTIKDVELLEASIVGIPANPRSWVKSAIRAYKASLKKDEAEPMIKVGLDLSDLIEDLDREIVERETIPDTLPEGPVKPEISRAASDDDADDEDRQDGPHQHSHAHAHDHEHTHGWGDNETTHSHDHAHSHSHEHDDGHHGSADDRNDWEHDHYHDGASGDHAHDKDATGLTLVSKHFPECNDQCDPATGTHFFLPDTDKSATPDTERPSDELELQGEEQVAAVEPGPEPTEIERALDTVVDSLTLKVKEQRSVISEQDAQIRQLKKDLDDTVQSLRLAMRFVEKLARTPLGKKTSFAAPISDFRRELSGVYDEEFLKFLENTDES